MNTSKTMITDLKTIGKRLCDIRKASGLSQEEVAIKAGITVRTYAAIERGETNPRLDTIIKICNTLGIFPDDIMTIDNPEFSQKEKDSLDKQLARLEPKIFEAKHRYDELMSKYRGLFEKRHPEKQEERIKEELFQAYRNSDRSMAQILSFMAGEEYDEW